ncbi:hypothetical protein S451_17025 [Salmonella enterica subsp. enterica]|nr:hypothetical protein [Salmonella enterica subsp. enterica]ECJ7251608.1 hypothetical protein [Salmonella enterica subsp. enterica]
MWKVIFFHLLLSVSMVRSDRIRRALEDVFVHGLSCEESCNKNAVTAARFSREYNHLINVNCKVADLCRLIHQETAQQI